MTKKVEAQEKLGETIQVRSSGLRTISFATASTGANGQPARVEIGASGQIAGVTTEVRQLGRGLGVAIEASATASNSLGQTIELHYASTPARKRKPVRKSSR